MNKKIEKLLVNVADVALRRRAKLILSALGPKDGDVILDVGCGDGYYLYLLHRLNKNTYSVGSDFDRIALDAAYENFKTNNIPVVMLSEKKYENALLKKSSLKKGTVYLIWADLMKKLPFEDETFDKVVMGEVAEHLPSDVKGIKEISRVMKNGAKLALTVPCSNYPFLWDPINWVLERTVNTHIKSGFFAGIWNQHIRLYSPEKIKKVVEKAGLNVENAYANTYWSLPFNHHIVNLGARILYGGAMPTYIAQSVDKYTTKKSKPMFLQFVFAILNSIDTLNEKFPHKKSGVGVFVEAVK